MFRGLSRERVAEILTEVRNANDMQTIEAYKHDALQHLRFLKEDEPLEFAEAQFQVACSYLFRPDKQVRARQLRYIQEHYDLAIGALTEPSYAFERGLVQCAFAEGFERLTSRKILRESALERAASLFEDAAVSFEDAGDWLQSATALSRCAELWVNNGDSTRAIAARDRVLSLLRNRAAIEDAKLVEHPLLTITQPTVRREDVEIVFSELSTVQRKLSDLADKDLSPDSEEITIASAKERIAAAHIPFEKVPPKLLDELFHAVDESPTLEPKTLYSPGELVHFHRARTAHMPPVSESDVDRLDSIGTLSGSKLAEYARQYRDAKTAPWGFALIPVHYATDRPVTGNPIGEHYFGNARDPDHEALLSFGLCYVSIPRRHITGVLEQPQHIWRLQWKANPRKHVDVYSMKLKEEGSFFSSFESQVAEAGGTALMFVHGYNSTFWDALKRTAQLCYDLTWPGVPITYSWSSRGETSPYPADEASVEATVPFLVRFLERVISRSKLHTLNVVCHSMGSRAVTHALAKLALTGRPLPLINEFILAAPDIDSQVFSELAKEFRSKCGRVTLYASSGDLALMGSHSLHAFPRAGESGPNMIVLPKLLDTIDVSDVDTDLIGHSYFGNVRRVIGDIHALLNGEPAAKRFDLREVVSPKGPYWAFKP
jgi:esterase/lipase superfamily enzyme